MTTWNVYGFYTDDGGPYATEVEATSEQAAIAQGLKQAREDNGVGPDDGSIDFSQAQAIERRPPAPLYVVEVFMREDGIYLFEREQDAKEFEAAVNGVFTNVNCNLLETPIITAEMAAGLIAQEREE
jgi:hypothetical protein